mgnify:FL=1
MTIAAGDLRHLMRIEIDVVVTDVTGKQRESRELVGTAWVKLQPIDLREFGVVPNASARPSHKAILRFRFLPKIFWFVSTRDGKEYKCNSLDTAAINIEERDRELHILVLEHV